MAAGLDLDSILAVGAFESGAFELDVLVDAFGSFCDDAAARGLRIELEFVPYWGVPDLPAAWDIVRGADRPNSGLLIDTWHLYKGSTDLERDLDLLATIPSGRLCSVQLADGIAAAQADTLYGDGRFRRFPGDGEFDLPRVVRLVEGRGALSTIGTEIFGDAIDSLSTVEAGRRSRAATEEVLRRALGR
jgi:sugar phosphate isomerase/epimerase